MPRSDDSQTSALLLRRVADVLFTCVDRVARIEDLITPMARSGLDRKELLALQDADLLRQGLGDIATCLARISDCQIRNEPVNISDILAPMLLNDLRIELMGQSVAARKQQDNCVLF